MLYHGHILEDGAFGGTQHRSSPTQQRSINNVRSTTFDRLKKNRRQLSVSQDFRVLRNANQPKRNQSYVNNSRMIGTANTNERESVRRTM